jgi:hypothetical protein
LKNANLKFSFCNSQFSIKHAFPSGTFPFCLPPSAFCLLSHSWSPRRDLNSHKTLTAGVALPLSYAGSFKAAGRIRTCIDEFRKLAPVPFGHGSDMVETMGLEPIHRVCRTRMPPTTSSPHSSSRGPESRTRTLLLPRQAASHQALTPKKAGAERVELPISRVTTERVAINTTPQFKWLEAESNRRRPTYEIGALPSELSSRDEISA